jgi:DnaK suppressor protein
MTARAGSAGVGRRSERRADGLVGCLAGCREALEQKRAFRRHQLAELEGRDRDLDPTRMDEWARARHEVRVAVAAGARQALSDIDVALRRMQDGKYGRCRACGSEIMLAVLEAIPESTLCLTCYRRAA